MDTTWINLNSRTSPEYIEGMMNFLDFAFQKSAVDGKILCPCRKCTNGLLKTKTVVIEHLVLHGFLRNYVF